MNTPVVLITGALTGIGRATAIAFAQEGARVVISGRHEDAGQTLAAELRDLGAALTRDADLDRDSYVIAGAARLRDAHRQQKGLQPELA